MKNQNRNSLARRVLTGSVSAFVGIGIVTQASAALYVYEGYDYVAGSDLSTQNGGSGWTEAWGTTPGDTAIGGSLGYTDAFGNTLVTSGNSAQYSGQFGTSSYQRRTTTTFGTDGTTIWLSFLAERTGPVGGDPNNPYPRGGSLISLNEWTGSTFIERLNIGNVSNAASNYWAINPSGGPATAVFSGVQYGGGGVSLALVRIDYGVGTGNDTAYLFLNPTDLSVEPSTANALAMVVGNFTFNSIRPFAGDASGTFNGLPRPYAVVNGDEIRVGDTYADVTPFIPVPEPSVSALLLLGLGAFMRRKRAA